MSFLDTYRNNVQRKNDEIARLQHEKATASKKIAELSGKINSASQSLSRATSTSAAKSKLGEIERYRKDQASAEKRIAELQTKIGQKQKEINAEQKKIFKEEETLQKKQNALYDKQSKANQAQIKTLNAAITKHDSLHRSTLSKLEELQRLPKNIVVLFLASNPVDQAALGLDEEARSITEMIRKAKHRDSVRLETRWAVRPLDIFQAINELDPTVLHFSGHGTDTNDLVLQNNQGQAQFVRKEAIIETIAATSDTIRLVFFNTCYSFAQAETIVQHIDTAIGMNTSIGDVAARVFSSQFYSAIGFGLSVKKAFDQAKAAIMLENIGEENTPELFTKDGLDANDVILVNPKG
ncbi:CHAT domain-containing protein [Dyadobacter sp. CY261]|uniref:CHAT domain-containing protein n=1 Tax=Dyadobacter sp. CY261 TaxID=2907203 RepID=UPI001F36D0F5|nr:CHAT domain-containing protein [Dyadobacter sp. CY261]MCF0075185.1 CHAT domain-containing protein [Dyadobacter sp. CY261]